ncbi:MAG: hypothetical protein KGJ02_01820 [Verrucomicrobiota bacterium]|nr:hypothetical protein [Verrucomicrobiota bacterium]
MIGLYSLSSVPLQLLIAQGQESLKEIQRQVDQLKTELFPSRKRKEPPLSKKEVVQISSKRKKTASKAIPSSKEITQISQDLEIISTHTALIANYMAAIAASVFPKPLPTIDWAHFQLLERLTEEGPEKALQFLQELRKSPHIDYRNPHHLATIFKEINPDTSASLFEEAIEQAPQNPSVLRNACWFHFKHNNVHRATELIAPLIERMLDEIDTRQTEETKQAVFEPSVFFLLIRILIEYKFYNHVIHFFDRALQQFPTYRPILSLQLTIQNIKEAIKQPTESSLDVVFPVHSKNGHHLPLLETAPSLMPQRLAKALNRLEIYLNPTVTTDFTLTKSKC